MLTAAELIAPIALHRGDAVVVTTMSVVRPWAEFSDHPLDFASADSAMGHAADFSLGLALAQPNRRVICLNGDGSLLMSLGSLATIGRLGAANLTLIIVANDAYEVTGGQSLPAVKRPDYAALALTLGFRKAAQFADPLAYAAAVPDLLAAQGPALISAAVSPGAERPLSRGPQESARYLRDSLRDSAHDLRRRLTAARPLVV